jgi:hypothetical protein
MRRRTATSKVFAIAALITIAVPHQFATHVLTLRSWTGP